MKPKFKKKRHRNWGRRKSKNVRDWRSKKQWSKSRRQHWKKTVLLRTEKKVELNLMTVKKLTWKNIVVMHAACLGAENWSINSEWIGCSGIRCSRWFHKICISDDVYNMTAAAVLNWRIMNISVNFVRGETSKFIKQIVLLIVD